MIFFLKHLKNIAFIVIFYGEFILIKFLGITITYLDKKFKKNRKKNSILYLENFPIENAGYQYRAAKWAEIFNKNGFYVEVLSITDRRDHFDNILSKKELKSFFLKSILKRLKQCIYSRHFETVIVRRELLFYNDYGNLFMEKFLLKIHNNVILDFDDDISAAKKQPHKINNLFGIILMENGNKFNESLKLYSKFIVCSEYLKNRILKISMKNPADICIIPTCVDYEMYQPKEYTSNNIYTFGWIGGNHNYYLLDSLIPVLNKIAKLYKFKLIIIGGSTYPTSADFEIEFYRWNINDEVQNLYKIDIGLMPLIDDDESRGKSGFKLIQYMGLGIPGIAGPITINNEIVEHEINSFLALQEQEWYNIITNLLNGKYEITKISENARKTILRKYSFAANFNKYYLFVKYNNHIL